MQEYPVKLLHEMLETYSQSGSEAGMADLVKRELQSLGMNPRIDSAGNVLALLGREGPEILLCGHMDTVPGEIPVKLQDGFLYGRGAVDAKSSLAAMMLGASKAVIEEKCPVRVRLACVIKEETTSDGFKTIIADGPSPDFAIFGEPSGLANIIVGYKGRILLQIECLTPGGHAASPWLTKNSAEEAHNFWTSLRQSLLCNESESKFNSLTGSLTGVATSGPDNSIPSHTRLTIDLRTPPYTDPGTIIARIENLARTYSIEHPDVQLFVIAREASNPSQADPHSRLVASCRGAIRRVTGETPTLLKKTGTSDMNLLPPATSAIAYGPGDSRLDHTDQERIEISEYLKSIEVYAETLKMISRLSRSELPIET
ncbi:M20/M25/M40 family metallo-hydrolase [Candidatus Bathyarchaeota archaeon]|nr:M20/M25/M40 family metallo-hydrolase [Candidatus Bathyarchaeota archaeon]